MEISKVYQEVKIERERQDKKFGESNHPSINESIPRKFRNQFYGIPTEEESRDKCESNHLNKSVTWADILIEEVAEVVNAKDERDRREELIQVAAVALAWVESIDRKEKKS